MENFNSPTDILNVLLSHNLTIPTIINHLLDGGHHKLRDDLLKNTTAILGALYRHQPDTVFSWAFDLVSQCLQSEILALTQSQHGFYFNLKQASASSLQASFMQDIAKKMKTVTPHLWGLLQSLLDARKDSRRSRALDR